MPSFEGTLLSFPVRIAVWRQFTVVALCLSWVEFIGVSSHMQRYFSHICDGTDVQADWRRSCTYGRAPNAIDISQGSLTCPSYTDTGPPFLYGDSDNPSHLVAFYDTLGTYSRLNPPASSRGCIVFDVILISKGHNSVEQNAIMPGARQYHFIVLVSLTNEFPWIYHVMHLLSVEQRGLKREGHKSLITTLAVCYSITDRQYWQWKRSMIYGALHNASEFSVRE